MDNLGGLLGGQGGGLCQLGGLISSFEQGRHDDVSDQQVHQQYGQVASQLPQDQYVQAAEQAMARLSPEQRQQLAQQLQTQAQQQGYTLPTGPQPQ